MSATSMLRMFVLAIAASLFLAACTPIVNQNELQHTPISTVDGTIPTQTTDGIVIAAPGPVTYDFIGIQQWFNLDNITNVTLSNATSLSRRDLLGKVVVVDFWTYSCINCIRTLPYLTNWDAKYKDNGLVIIGVHAPEFKFEEDPVNVQKALVKYGIHYPVGLDNHHNTWDNYKNRYWPHSYVFDRTGKLVFDHIGEGGYDELERVIQEELNTTEEMTKVALPDFGKVSSPEIYLGGITTRGNTDFEGTLGTRSYILLAAAKRDQVQIGGTWTIEKEFITAGADARLQLKYHARDIHLVAGGSGTIAVTVDGKVMQTLTINGDQLYTLARTDYKDQTILLSISPGVNLYSFTFG